MSANDPCDMHTHTTNSDGNESYRDLISRAAGLGLKAVAIVDHDVLPLKTIFSPEDEKNVPAEQYAATKGICLFRGVEFSCETQVEDVHIVALGCDWDDPAIVQQISDIEWGKERSYTETVCRLNEKGFSMSMEEILEFAGVTIKEIQKKHIFNFMAAKGYAEDWSKAKLLVRDTPYFSVKREKPDSIKILNMVHEAGGICILAHPYLIDENIVFRGQQISRGEFLERLIGAGLDGIEVRYTYHKTTCKDKRPEQEIWEDVRRIAAGRVFVSGGSDYHGDWKKNVQSPRELGECGLTMEEFLSVDFFRTHYMEIQHFL